MPDIMVALVVCFGLANNQLWHAVGAYDKAPAAKPGLGSGALIGRSLVTMPSQPLQQAIQMYLVATEREPTLQIENARGVAPVNTQAHRVAVSCARIRLADRTVALGPQLRRTTQCRYCDWPVGRGKVPEA